MYLELAVLFVFVFPLLYSRRGSWNVTDFRLKTYRLFKLKVLELLKKLFYPSALRQELDNIFLPSSRDEKLEEAKQLFTHQSDNILFLGADGKGFRLAAKITRFTHSVSEAHLLIRIPGESVYTLTSQTSKMAGTWSSGSLQFDLNEPMKCWRISFNGSVRSTGNVKHHVKLNLIWRAFCKPNCHTSGENTGSRKETDDHYVQDLDGYDQWGSLIGTMKIGGRLRGVHVMSSRQRFWGNGRRSTVVGFAGIGTLYAVEVLDQHQKNCGNVRHPNGTTTDVSRSFQFTSSASNLQLKFSGEKRRFSCVARPDPRTEASSRNVKILSFDGFLNEDVTEGFLLTWDSGSSASRLDSGWLDPSAGPCVESEILLLDLSAPLCRNARLVGGKAASLAALTGLESASAHSLDAKVPWGFCLTKTAMDLQIRSSRDLKAVMKTLTLSSTSSELQEICKRLEEAWLSTKVCTEIGCVLDKQIEPGVSYAVRSSGLTEDMASISSAGQNASCLGRIGSESVLRALQLCWASLYSYQSVQYRRIHGLPMRSSMGVVVQKMVASEIAGVMFTCDPVTGDHSTMIVTANYGLGETVVSGAVEPDTIKLARSDSQLDTAIPVTVISEECGNKTHQLSLAVDGIIVKLNLNDSTANQICISSEEAVNLAKVGIQLEKEFGSPCDIEWAIAKNELYLLQCRPITTLHTWTDEELLHEFDSAILPTEIVSTANTGEVLPKATSLLSQSLLVRAVDVAILLMKPDFVKDFYNNNAVIVSQHQALLNVLNTVLEQVEESRSIPQLAIELAICGHVVTSDDIQALAVKRNDVAGFRKKLKSVLKAVQSMCWAESVAKEAEQHAACFSIAHKDCASASELFVVISGNLDHLMQAALRHSLISAVNVFWQIIILTVLLEGETDPTSDHLEDVCKILRSCTSVMSAEIPSSLEEIAAKILECENYDDFCKMPPSLAKNWIKINCPKAACLLSKFLISFGHRSVREMDLFTETWGLNSTPLLANIQTLVRGRKLNKTQKVAKVGRDIVAELTTPKKSSTRSVLRRILPLCNRSSGWREVTKDSLLRVIHALRSSYHRLGSLMARENYIPHPHLLFFCTHYEIKKLLESRDPVILQKTLRRQRLYSQWENISFPEIMIGAPQSLSDTKIEFKEGERTAVKGTLVFPGRVEGRACVVQEPEDANEVRMGDVLVMRSTDIGWSPLFPLVSGIVTELGGLISHGAVVAREFGIPSLVGAVSATSVFKTGDRVVLDGPSGVVYRVE